MLDDERREVLRRAGERFRAAQQEHARASAALREALAAADGDTTPDEAAAITGLDSAITAVLLGQE